MKGGNKKRKKKIRACSLVLCLLRVYCIDCKYQAVSTPPQLPQSWGQLCPGRGGCDENASILTPNIIFSNLRNRTPLMASISTIAISRINYNNKFHFFSLS